jgi:DNA-binding LytR/AlgR family response regulator
MQSIKCIIIDDEPLARKGLKEYISEVDFLQLEGSFESALKATRPVSEGQVQLIFLDIQMPKISGLDFLKTMSTSIPVIFTTAYPEFALEGFELNALDYLVKPISFERFLKAALKAKEYYEVRHKTIPKGQAVSPGKSFFSLKLTTRLSGFSLTKYSMWKHFRTMFPFAQRLKNILLT